MKILPYGPLLLLLLFVLPADGFGQNKRLVQANEAFRQYQLTNAAKLYRKAYTREKNRNEKNRISFQLAETYRLMNQWKRAEANYRRIIRTDYAKENPVIYLHYANTLMMGEKYDDARTYYQMYTEAAPTDIRGQNGLLAIGRIEEWKENPTKYEVENIRKMNSKYDDFAPAFYDKMGITLIFTSSRLNNKKSRAIDNWTGQGFSDLYISRQDRTGNWGAADPADTDGRLNTGANEGTPAFNDKFNVMYFTRCDNSEGKVTNCRIYVARRSGRGWSDIKEVMLGRDSLVVDGHPALSPDERTLVFASDRPGGQGGKDLWMSTRFESGDGYMRPVNMGAILNTPGDEVFPHFRDDTTLYFSSNGHIGMGGLDIYKTVFTNGAWSVPVNLEVPMNSVNDDFGIVFLGKEDQGFFSSNRPGGRGGDDIYSFINPPLVFAMQGSVKNSQNLQPIEATRIVLKGNDGSRVEARTDAQGYFAFSPSQIKQHTHYEITALKDGFLNETVEETTVGLIKNKEFKVDFLLDMIPEKPVVLPDILYDLAKWDLKPQFQDSLRGLVQTLLSNESLVIELGSHTDNRGTEESNDILSQRRAESVVSYLIERGIDPERLVAKGYGERVPRTLTHTVTRRGLTLPEGAELTEEYINAIPNNATRELAHELNRRSEFRILRKDFSPKSRNQFDTIIHVAIEGREPAAPAAGTAPAPNANIVTLSRGFGGTLLVPIEINGQSTRAVYDDLDRGLVFSVRDANRMIETRAISQTDFSGKPETVFSNGTIRDGSVFRIRELKIGTRVLRNVEATVTDKLSEGVYIGQSVLRMAGQYELDESGRRLIYR